MKIRESLQVVRRRLVVVVALLVLGVAAGWATAPGSATTATSFRATHTLIYEPQGGQSYNIEQLALLATSGAVPSRVAAAEQMDRSHVRSAVSAVADVDVATISISARAAEPGRAESLADTTAAELVAELSAGAQAAYQAEIDRLTAQVDDARARLAATRTPALQPPVRAELEAAGRDLAEYQVSPGPPKPALKTLEPAVAGAVAPEGVQAPNSKPVRAMLLGVVGLLAGLGAAVALDRTDSRIRTREMAENAFAAPVITEVPPLPRNSEGQLVIRTQPSSAFLEAYRGVRTYVALWAQENGEDDGHRVIVVTSAGASEGKTTTVAHVAALLAEMGRSVIVVSADLRRPQLHGYFDRPAGPGLVDVLSSDPGAPIFEALDLSTSVRGVRLVRSGPAVDNPAPLFEKVGGLIRRARTMADFVLIDTPPLLVANDAVDLARHADGVLVVARSGRTRVEAAQRSAELLARLEIPVVGAVLVDSEAAESAYRHYGAKYYAEPVKDEVRRPRGPGEIPMPADAAPDPQPAGQRISGS